MGRMVRKQIVMEPALEEALERHARVMGISQSQLVSQALHRFIEEEELREKRLAAWRDAERIMNGEGPDGKTGGQLPWTREELHERGRFRTR